MKNNKGITLIVLIITVIIMLILVGVVIDINIDNNLINNAQNAVDRTNDRVGQTQSRVDELMGELTEVKQSQCSHTFSNNVCTQCGYSIIGKRVSRNEEYKIGGKTAIIPEKFTLSGYTGGTLGENETTIEGGLVIYDIPAGVTIDWTNETQVNTARTTYNQFVWIPVEFAKQDGATYETDTNFNDVWKRSAWTTSEDGGTRTTGLSTDYTEPHSTYDNKTTGTTGIEAELESMRASVYKYGGFYIARYEAGSTTERTSLSSAATPIFVQDAYPYNYVAWGDPSKSTSADKFSMGYVGSVGAVYLSRNIEFKSGSTKVTSMLCSGVAWDAMLDFVKDANHNVTSSANWGNCKDSETYSITRTTAKGAEYTTTLGSFATITQVAKGSKILLTTGASERNKMKNLYDIAGNCYEWTTEANGQSYRFLRGRILYRRWL